MFTGYETHHLHRFTTVNGYNFRTDLGKRYNSKKTFALQNCIKHTLSPLDLRTAGHQTVRAHNIAATKMDHIILLNPKVSILQMKGIKYACAYNNICHGISTDGISETMRLAVN